MCITVLLTRAILLYCRQYKGRIPLVCTIALFMTLGASSENDTDWIPAAQTAILQTSGFFERVLLGTSEMELEGKDRLTFLRAVSARVSGVIGVAGALFSIILAFLPPQESAELKLMKSEFSKLSQKIDSISIAIDDVKNLVKLNTQEAKYIQDENKINTGYSRMLECHEAVSSITCYNRTDCRTKKVQKAGDYLKYLDIRSSIENILRGTTSDGVFSTSLLILLKEASSCNVPKINRFTNRLTALIMKGMFVAMFHDLLTNQDFEYLGDVTRTSNMLRDLEKARKDTEDSCLNNIDYWMRLVIGNSHQKFTSNSSETNKILLQTLVSRFPWIQWQVCTSKGKIKPGTGPKNSERHKFLSSSEDKNVHAVAIPATEGRVTNLKSKRANWRKLVSSLNINVDDLDNEVLKIQDKINKSLELEGQVQSFAILHGEDFYIGYYNYNGQKIGILHQELLSKEEEINNVNLNFRLHKGSGSRFAFVVTFRLEPKKCSKSCKRGTCRFLPYSTEMVCRCQIGFNGERCEFSDTDIHQHAVINSLIRNTVKLPTFTSMQRTLEDIQLYVTVSLSNVEKSIARIEASIDEEFKILGAFLTEKFKWNSIRSKYKESIGNLKYFQTLYERTISEARTTDLIGIFPTNARDEKEIASYLMSPIGIQKWLYQLDFLITGRKDDVLDSHESVVFMVMDRIKHLLCFPDYKQEIERTYQQLMLLQLQGYAMWTWAYSLDSTSIQKRYQTVLSKQAKYFNDNTCSITIPNSVNMHNCSGGFYIHSAMDTSVVCKPSYYLDGKGYFVFSSMYRYKTDIRSGSRKCFIDHLLHVYCNKNKYIADNMCM